jgi:hypothetical protein
VGIILIGLGLVALGFLIYSIINGSLFKNAGPASLTAFHDFQPKDKREAVEVVIEQKAGKRMFESTSEGAADPSVDVTGAAAGNPEGGGGPTTESGGHMTDPGDRTTGPEKERHPRIVSKGENEE